MAEQQGGPDLDRLGAYFAARSADRAAKAVAKWEALTTREKALVREAAVMGYVQGQRAYDSDVPRDAEIVAQTLIATDSFADLYPVLAALPRRRRAPSARLATPPPVGEP